MKTKSTQRTTVLLKMLNVSYFILIILLIANHSYGQAPAFSYATPQIFTAGVAITPLAPANTGGAVPPGLIDTLSSGITTSGRLATDAAGNLYIWDNGMIKKFPAGGGEPIVIATGLDELEAIAADAVGNVYMSDMTGNYTGVIKKYLLMVAQ